MKTVAAPIYFSLLQSTNTSIPLQINIVINIKATFKFILPFHSPDTNIACPYDINVV